MSESCEHDNPLCSACEAEIFSLRAEREALSGQPILSPEGATYLKGLFESRWKAKFDKAEDLARAAEDAVAHYSNLQDLIDALAAYRERA